MLPVQPQHPGRYPPGPKWAQFGDDVIGSAMNAHIQARLASKRQTFEDFHIDRLQQDGFMPMAPAPSQHPASRPDPEEPAVNAFDAPDVEMQSPGQPPPPPPASRTMRDTGTGPDGRDMAEIGVQSGGGPPPPPDRRHAGSNTENPRSEAGTQASFQPPPPPPPPSATRITRETGTGPDPDVGVQPPPPHPPPPPDTQRRQRSHSPVEQTSSGRPPPPPPGAGGAVAVQRRSKSPQDVLMVSSTHGRPPPPPGGPMEVDRPAERKRVPDTDIGEVMKDAATAAARARRRGELERATMQHEHMKGMQQAHLDHLMRERQAKVEADRNHAAQLRGMQHQRDVAVSVATRGRQAPAPAATVAYPRANSVATRAYPKAQQFNIGERSRSPLLPTKDARSVSTRHSRSPDSLSAWMK